MNDNQKHIQIPEASGSMKIYTYPDPILRTKASLVGDIDGELQKLVENMAKTMYEAPGIGLAATQVGVDKRLIIFDLAPREKGRNLSVLINPEIVLTEGKIIYEEACLSVTDFCADVERSSNVKVKGVDLKGNPVGIEAEGLLAICLQHEIDHLNGVLYIDHISNLKRSLYKKKLKKALKNKVP